MKQGERKQFSHHDFEIIDTERLVSLLWEELDSARYNGLYSQAPENGRVVLATRETDPAITYNTNLHFFQNAMPRFRVEIMFTAVHKLRTEDVKNVRNMKPNTIFSCI